MSDLSPVTNGESGSVKLPESDLAARIRALEEALRGMVEEKCDYMTINHLGDPEKTHTVKWARAALKEPK